MSLSLNKFIYCFQRQDKERAKNQAVQKHSNKPIQKVSPRVRAQNVRNGNDFAVTNRLSNSQRTKKSQPKPIFTVKPRNTADSSVGSVPLQYEIVEVNSSRSSHVNSDECTVVESQSCDHTQIPRKDSIPRSENSSSEGRKQSSRPIITILSNEIISNKLQQTENQDTLVNNKENKKKSSEVVRKISKTHLLTNQKNFKKQFLLTKLCKIVESFKKKHLQWDNIKGKKLLAVCCSIQAINIYVTLVKFNFKMANNNVKRVGKEAVDELNRRSKFFEEIAVEQQEINSPTSINVASKRNPKTQRSDNTRLMLLPETKEDINEKDLGE